MPASTPSSSPKPPSDSAREPSMPRIAVLSEHVRNQIAAGEVIERPASVVKELVENALDSGATQIEVELATGGLDLVRVRDDGSGMGRADLELAFVPHATSKLGSVEDLEHIASLGFRGEALASMGAVARCSIVSREAHAPTGWRIENEGGRLHAPVETGAPRGTTVDVRGLFYNVPARRRFLKSPAAELGRALDVVQRLALAHERVGFVVTHDGARVFDVEAGMDLRARIRRAFGADLALALAPVEARDGDLLLSGFVAPPRLARSDASRQMWFLNGRPLRDRVLLRALKDGYRGFLFESRQPVAFLRLSMDPARVDVNVHPAKAEVRLRDEKRIFGLVVSAVRAALSQTDLATPGARLVDTALRRESAAGERTLWTTAAAREPFVVRDLPARPFDTLPADSAGSAGSAPESARASHDGPASMADARRVGPFLQIARTYIVREVSGGFEIVDQHALHERITFEALRAELAAGALEMQRLLVPELIELAPHELALIVAHAPALQRAGLAVEPFGATTLALQALPARLARPRTNELVRDVVKLLEEERSLEPERLLEEVLHRAACRSSVMAGDALAPAEIESLLARGAALENDQTCVHGRPTRVRFTLGDLERAFLRRA